MHKWPERLANPTFLSLVPTISCACLFNPLFLVIVAKTLRSLLGIVEARPLWLEEMVKWLTYPSPSVRDAFVESHSMVLWRGNVFEHLIKAIDKAGAMRFRNRPTDTQT